jgi:hypothetical protein
MDNAFLSTGHIALWFLLLGLILPRLTIFIAWLETGIPVNPMPDLANFVLWLLFPRFLIAFYIYTDQGMNNIWFWAYIILGIFGLIGEGGYAQRRVVRRRTTVSRDGNTTTTVEEEEV